MLAPLAVELFAGTGSATAGWCALGGRAICFDLEYLAHHGKPHASQRRVIQDVLTLHGSQFRDAAFIWGSPPCQKYSYLAMPWSRSKPTGECIACRGTGLNPPGQQHEAICLECEGEGVIHNSKAAKALRKKWETEGPDNRLFDACFRIQREAIEATRMNCRECGIARCLTEIQRCESQLMAGEYPAEMEGLLLGLHDWTCELRLLRAAGCSNCNGEGSTTRYIPLIVENVRGAIPWVGPSKANYGSFHLWGDVEMVGNRIFVADEWKRGGAGLRAPTRIATKNNGGGGWFAIGNAKQKNCPDGRAHTRNLTPQGNGIVIEDSGQKVPGFRFDGSGRSFQTASVEVTNDSKRMDSGDDAARSNDRISGDGSDEDGVRESGLVLSGVGLKSRTGGGWFGDSSSTRVADPRDVRKMPDGSWQTPDGTKIGGDWFSDPNSTCRKHGSRSNARKAASAMIAKIPLPLSNYIAQTFYPKGTEHEN